GPAGSFSQRAELSTTQRAILARLELAEPPRISELQPGGARFLSLTGPLQA
ncbi:MAG: hypothetical protein FJ000_07530, partial [Actinobacteria bacterium]|nr:hypothetical protein [Actinomycetota bacterium]